MRNMPLVAAARPWCGSNPNCKWGPYLKRQLCLQVVNMALFTHSLCRHLQPGSSLRSHPEKYHRSCALRASTRLGSGRVAGFVYRSSARLAHLIKAHSICTGRGFFSPFFFCYQLRSMRMTNMLPMYSTGCSKPSGCRLLWKQSESSLAVAVAVALQPF